VRSQLGNTRFALRAITDPSHGSLLVDGDQHTRPLQPFWLDGRTGQLLAAMGVVYSTGDLRELDKAPPNAQPCAVLFRPFISPPTSESPLIELFARAGLLSFDQDVRLPELARRALRRSGKLHATAISTCALPPAVRITGSTASSKSIHARDPRNLVELRRTCRCARRGGLE
jgi:hypothetical protein